jgi:hypothetical protein
MYVKPVAIALLVLAVVATAQQAEILDVKKVEKAGEGSLHTAKIIGLAFNYLALGLMIGASIYILVVRKRSLPELFGEWWFWVPIALNLVPVILYLISDFTPLIGSLYKWIREDPCPFLYCP